MTSPLIFSFDTEPGLTQNDIYRLWEETQTAQNAIDRFLAGEFSEQEMTDLLTQCEIDCDQARETLDHNAQAMGMIQIS